MRGGSHAAAAPLCSVRTVGTPHHVIGHAECAPGVHAQPAPHLITVVTDCDPVLPPWPMMSGTKNDSSTWCSNTSSNCSTTSAASSSPTQNTTSQPVRLRDRSNMVSRLGVDLGPGQAGRAWASLRRLRAHCSAQLPTPCCTATHPSSRPPAASKMQQSGRGLAAARGHSRVVGACLLSVLCVSVALWPPFFQACEGHAAGACPAAAFRLAASSAESGRGRGRGRALLEEVA